MTRVSVSIVTCDQAEYIGAAIDSVLAQDYPDLEIVVADDASRDGTIKIVVDRAQRYPGLVKAILHDGPRSITDNWIRALSACTGTYISHLDGDDLQLPGKLARQVEAMQRVPDAVLCHHPMKVIDAAGSVLEVRDQYPHPGPVPAAELVARGNFTVTSSLMYRRAAMPPLHLLSPLRYAPDWLLAIETARRGVIVRVPHVLGAYRVHPAQITAAGRRDELVYADAMRTLDHVERYHPELREPCREGRRVLTRWEAFRRLRGRGDLAWMNAGLRRALRHDPASPRLWMLLGVANLRARRRRVN